MESEETPRSRRNRVKSLMIEPRAEWENQMCKCVKSGENHMTADSARRRTRRRRGFVGGLAFALGSIALSAIVRIRSGFVL